MTNNSYSFTSESVCAGHPDKICDQISDAIVDDVLKQDKYGRVAIETLVTYNRVVIAGEVSAQAKVDFEGILEGLNLRRPIYLPTAAYGHFGRNEFPWEKVSLISIID